MAAIRATQASWVRSAEATDGEPPQAAAPAGAAALEPNTHRYTSDDAVARIRRDLGGVVVGERRAVAMN